MSTLEETKKVYERLFEQCGLKVKKYWEKEGSPTTIIEVVKV